MPQLRNEVLDLDAVHHRALRERLGLEARAGETPRPEPLPENLAGDRVAPHQLSDDLIRSHRGGTASGRFFDGQGRFVYTTLSEVDVPEVIGYGQAAGDPGSYRVLGSNRGDEVHLTFDNGSRVVMYVHHLYRGEIMELWYDDIVYAPGLCPGAEP